MKTLLPLLCRELPDDFEPLINLALDLRLTWTHGGDKIWAALDPEIWEETRNPWWVLQNISQDRIEHLIKYKALSNIIKDASDIWKNYKETPGWFRQNYLGGTLGTVAYFSMEFGLSEALPIYAGGLGILAGDFLKTASDLDVPMVGVGLLYQEGYFRQMLDASGMQMATFPHNDLTNLPLKPAIDKSGGWLMVSLELPGRILRLRVWVAQIGRIQLFLLDSNVQTNSPIDRSIVSKLYDAQTEFRLVQEMILGIAGWRALRLLNIPVEICHINEGHAAFVVLERTLDHMKETGLPFRVALAATRAANVFTTHTPVAAGFDTYPSTLLARYFRDYVPSLGISMDEFLSLGRSNPEDVNELFNMAILATRGSIEINGVSRLHEKVSQRIFQPLYPNWPEREVPVGHITNGIHLPTWNSRYANSLLNQVNQDYWRGTGDQLSAAIKNISDAEFWAIRKENKKALVKYVQERVAYQLKQNVTDPVALDEAQRVLSPEILTIGFARRFTSYKRPNLLLHDEERLSRILTNPECPVQLVVAGKAHPSDDEGKHIIQQFISFVRKPEIRSHAAFLADYDIELAQQLVQGVDVWINTPKRPQEACGTSGMKVLVNGGLNLSELDGWWAEAYTPAVGWHIGDGQEHSDPDWDSAEAIELYEILEKTIVPEYYCRNSEGLPVSWINRIRNSMSELVPKFSSNRMVRDYVRKIYIPATLRFMERIADHGRLANELTSWQESLDHHWPEIHFGKAQILKRNDHWHCEAEVYLGEVHPDFVRIELFADADGGHEKVTSPLSQGNKLNGTVNGYIYRGLIVATRPKADFAIRVMPYHPAAKIPLEANHILWKYPIES
ncbi:MAG: alpha-glucan family phosphorylase [Dehalococcoidia bacterium]|jgi:starch phosphorylase